MATTFKLASLKSFTAKYFSSTLSCAYLQVCNDINGYVKLLALKYRESVMYLPEFGMDCEINMFLLVKQNLGLEVPMRFPS